MKLPDARVVTETILAPPARVYRFARRMQNLPRWASGLASGIRKEKGRWYTDSPMGKVRVEMAPKNEHGVLDHDVTLPDGSRTHNAFRVSPAGEGSILTFVVLRQPGGSAKSLAKDVAHVKRDLAALRALLEAPAA